MTTLTREYPIMRCDCQGQMITTAAEASEIAQELLGSPDREWMVALYLSPRQHLLAWHESVDPGELFWWAVYEHAVSVVTVRYYPHPGPFDPETVNPCVQALQRMSDRMGVPLQDYVIQYRGGRMISWRELLRRVVR
jgi:hypothetical protein